MVGGLRFVYQLGPHLDRVDSMFTSKYQRASVGQLFVSEGGFGHIFQAHPLGGGVHAWTVGHCGVHLQRPNRGIGTADPRP